MSDFPILDSTVTPIPIHKSYLTKFNTTQLITEIAKYQREGLNCTIVDGTLVAVDGNDMDATALKLVQRLSELNEQQSRISLERKAILTALEIAGVKPQGPLTGQSSSEETRYRTSGAFKGRSLPASCETVLKDQKDRWFSKSEIEYLIVQGGYEFSTGNSKNSIGITLQRMAKEGLCEVQRVRGGQQGNRYRWPSESEQAKEET
jgi:hypothetical protein